MLTFCSASCQESTPQVAEHVHQEIDEMDADVRRKIEALGAQVARLERVHVWRTANANFDGTTVDEATLALTNTYLVPVFPTGRMLLKAVYVPLRVTAAPPANSTVQLGLYRVHLPTLIDDPTVLPKVGRHEFELIQAFDVTYVQGNLSAMLTAIAGTSLLGQQMYTRVIGTLPNARYLEPGVQYAIGIRPNGANDVAAPAPTLLVDAPSYEFDGATSTGPLPQVVNASARFRTPALTLLSPQAAYILGG